MQKQNNAPPVGGAASSIAPATCGKLVAYLLEQQNAKGWQNDLWAIFTGFMVNQANEGNNPKLADLFATFRDLQYFFAELNAVEEGKESGKQ